jgi:hypothetical protein
MLGFKDPTGACGQRVNDAIDAVQVAYLGVSIRQLESLVSVQTLSIEDYGQIKKLALPGLRKAQDDDARRIRAVCAKARAKMIQQGEAEARGFVAAGRNLTNYLKARTVLLALTEEIVATADEKAGVEKVMADVTQTVRMAQRDYEFNPTNGYALNTKDRARIAATKSCRAEPTADVGPSFREECLMILHQAPPALTNGSMVTVTTTLVFNRLSAVKRDYAVAVIGKRGDAVARAYIKIPKLVLTGGRADIRLSLNTAVLQGAEPCRDGEGSFLLVCLAFRPAGAPDAPDPWKTISPPYRIRVAPPPEAPPTARTTGRDPNQHS